MTSGVNTSQATGGKYRLSTTAWPTERWVVAIALVCIAFLILVRYGFREINVLGVRVGQ